MNRLAVTSCDTREDVEWRSEGARLPGPGAVMSDYTNTGLAQLIKG